MRILLDQSVHDHRNTGNNALIEAAINRLKKLWPDASIEVLTVAPHFCRVYIPHSKPISPFDLQAADHRLDFLHRLLPKAIWRLLFEIPEALYDRIGLNVTMKKLYRFITALARRNRPQQARIVDREESLAENLSQMQLTADRYHNIANYDLFVAPGGGYLCDTDKRFVLQLFDRLEAAVNHGVPAVMLGQGVGPIEDAELQERAKEVLPLAEYILIREEQVGRPLLESLGVSQDKMMMTGDDAIELAYQNRRQAVGTGIGISLRIAPYTAMEKNHLEIIRPIIHQAAHKYNAALIAAPISCYRHDADIDYISHIMDGYNNIMMPSYKVETPEETIQRVSNCRLMISGTLHGAIFAIGQGIPVIVLAKSLEYRNKLGGLTIEFGEKSCQLLLLSDEHLGEKLAEAIDIAWSSAEELRPQILANAARQIEQGYAAYQKVFEMANQRTQERRERNSKYIASDIRTEIFSAS